MRHAPGSMGLMCAVLLASASAQATVIQYDVTNLAGSSWRYDYTVTNDTLNAPLSEFTIYFDLALFSNLASLASPGDWSPLVAQPDPLLPADGFYDSLSLGLGVLPTQSVMGFSVTFDWLGQGTPGSQHFDIVDSTVDPVNVLDSGVTTLAPPTVSVPEPAGITTNLMFLAGVGAVLLRLRRTNKNLV